MTRLAAADDSRFSVSTVEVEREGPSYTYETLELLARERGDTELVFVMGADAAVGLESWREPERVVELARIAVARRSGVSDAEVGAVLRSLGASEPGDDARDAAVRRLLLGRARAGRRRAAAPIPGARVGRALHRREGGLLVSELDSTALARRLAELADAKGAADIVVLDMRKLVSYTDFLAICTARNERQAKAIVDEARLGLKRDSGLLPAGTDGEGAAGWIVLDYLDAVLHVFTAEARERYQLEDLWREAPRVDVGLAQNAVRGHLYGAAHG